VPRFLSIGARLRKVLKSFDLQKIVPRFNAIVLRFRERLAWALVLMNTSCHNLLRSEHNFCLIR